MLWKSWIKRNEECTRLHDPQLGCNHLGARVEQQCNGFVTNDSPSAQKFRDAKGHGVQLGKRRGGLSEPNRRRIRPYARPIGNLRWYRFPVNIRWCIIGYG